MDITSLLSSPVPPPSPETLNEVLSRSAAEWSEADLEAIVSGLREQRTRWTAEQSVGSRKLVRSSSITVKKTPFSGLRTGLKKVEV